MPLNVSGPPWVVSIPPAGASSAVGPYANTTLLEAAYPAAANTGRTAYVGASAPYTVYVSNGAAYATSAASPVTSVAGRTGAVALTAADVSGVTPLWLASTVYTAGQKAVHPVSGRTVTALSNHTSGSFFDAELWIFPTDDGSTLFDFTQLADGNATTIYPTKGVLNGRGTTTVADLVILDGALQTVNTHPNFYFTAGLVNPAEIIQHMWFVADVDAATPTNTGVTFLFLDPVFVGGIQAGIHWGALMNTGSGQGLWGSGPYPGGLGGIADGPSFTDFRPNGRRVRFDITCDKTTGTMVGYIDGSPCMKYTDIDVLGYISNRGAVQFPGGWVRGIEFGVSPRLPLFDTTGSGTPQNMINNGFFGNQTLTTAWQSHLDFYVRYPASGAILVEWSPFINCTAGYVEMELATYVTGASGSPGDAPNGADFPFIRVADAGTNCRVSWNALRRGTPGTIERLSLSTRISAGGSATLRNSDWGGRAGPRWSAATFGR